MRLFWLCILNIIFLGIPVLLFLINPILIVILIVIGILYSIYKFCYAGVYEKDDLV